MAGDLRSLYLLPVGATHLLDDEPCGGRVPTVRKLTGVGWTNLPTDDCIREDGPALALIHEGRVLPLAWWRAWTTIHRQPCDARPDLDDADGLARRGETLGFWRVVREAVRG